MRFLVDSCAESRALLSALRDFGCDVQSGRERLPHASDEEVLAFSVAENRVLITEDNDSVSATPGTQAASFFGIAASPDVRGSLGDVYFRGVCRLVNANGWVTLIGATSRADIVRCRGSAFVDDVAKTNLAAVLEQFRLGNVRSLWLGNQGQGEKRGEGFRMTMHAKDTEEKVRTIEGRLLMADFKEQGTRCRVHPSVGDLTMSL